MVQNSHKQRPHRPRRRPAPYTPERCHTALLSENPIYASLKVTQKPSWVREPSQLKPNSSSSLAFFFGDPDGAKAKALLAARQLPLFGATATTKDKPNLPSKPTNLTAPPWAADPAKPSRPAPTPQVNTTPKFT